MIVSFFCVLIIKILNILENLGIKLFWRNRLGFEDIKLYIFVIININESKIL